jgi:hypothetical protein
MNAQAARKRREAKAAAHEKEKLAAMAQNSRRGSVTHTNLQVNSLRERMAKDRADALVVRHTVGGRQLKAKMQEQAMRGSGEVVEDEMDLNEADQLVQTREERAVDEYAQNRWGGSSEPSTQDPSIGALVQVSNTAVLSMDISEKDIAEIEDLLYNAKSKNVQTCMSTLLVSFYP